MKFSSSFYLKFRFSWSFWLLNFVFKPQLVNDDYFSHPKKNQTNTQTENPSKVHLIQVLINFVVLQIVFWITFFISKVRGDSVDKLGLRVRKKNDEIPETIRDGLGSCTRWSIIRAAANSTNSQRRPIWLILSIKSESHHESFEARVAAGSGRAGLCRTGAHNTLPLRSGRPSLLRHILCHSPVFHSLSRTRSVSLARRSNRLYFSSASSSLPVSLFLIRASARRFYIFSNFFPRPHVPPPSIRRPLLSPLFSAICSPR